MAQWLRTFSLHWRNFMTLSITAEVGLAKSHLLDDFTRVRHKCVKTSLHAIKIGNDSWRVKNEARRHSSTKIIEVYHIRGF